MFVFERRPEWLAARRSAAQQIHSLDDAIDHIAHVRLLIQRLGNQLDSLREMYACSVSQQVELYGATQRLSSELEQMRSDAAARLSWRRRLSAVASFLQKTLRFRRLQ
jgi:hypothetical protein